MKICLWYLYAQALYLRVELRAWSVAIGEEAAKRQRLGDTLTKVTQVLTFCKAEKIKPSPRTPASLIYYVIQ